MNTILNNFTDKIKIKELKNYLINITETINLYDNLKDYDFTILSKPQSSVKDKILFSIKKITVYQDNVVLTFNFPIIQTNTNNFVFEQTIKL